MYDEKYERDEYELLAVLHDEECAEENMPPVIAQPDWDEYTVQHNIVGVAICKAMAEEEN